MKLVSITPARNEECMIGFTLRALLRVVDHAVVLVHASTDRTRAIVEEIAREQPVTVLVDDDPVWREMAQRQRLLETARGLGATHVATIDADEVLSGNLAVTGVVRDQMKSLPPGSYLQLPMKNMWGGIGQYAVSAPSKHGRFVANWGNAQTTFGFADAARLCWQVQGGGYDHHHREPFNARLGSFASGLAGGLLHLQFADRRRLVAKHAAYKVTERLRWPDKPVRDIDALYNLAVKPHAVQVAAAPAEWLAPYADILHHLDLGSEPWQERWVREQVELHGAEKFAGLDLFGLEGEQCQPVLAATS